MKSNCCQDEIQVISGDEGTSYYQCVKCKRACDSLVHIASISATQKTKRGWEEEFDKKFLPFVGIKSFIRQSHIELLEAVKGKVEGMKKPVLSGRRPKTIIDDLQIENIRDVGFNSALSDLSIHLQEMIKEIKIWEDEYQKMYETPNPKN